MEAITFTDAQLEGGKLIVKIPRESLGVVMGWIRKKKDRPYDLTIAEHRKKRSIDANAYAWVLIHKLAEAMRMNPEEVYLLNIPRVGDNYTVMCVLDQDVDKLIKVWQGKGIGWPVKDLGPSNVSGFRNLICYHGSSTYDTAQMSRLIDNLVQDCKAIGIETLSERELSLLKEKWQ